MTDFLRLDMTIASTGNGMRHFIGFDVLRQDWSDLKTALQLVDPDNTLDFREGAPARSKELSDAWCWVWVVVKEQTPIAVLMRLAKASHSYEEIKFCPNEFP